jgi:hypothetical protein
LIEQLSALAYSLCLAAVGQKADMAQALKAVGHNMREKTADELVRWQGHGLDAIALASISKPEAYLSVADLLRAQLVG